MAFPSANAFRDFDRSVRRELRYLRSAAQKEFLAAQEKFLADQEEAQEEFLAAQEEFLKEIIATGNSRIAILKPGRILWRAQLGHDWREQDDKSFKIPAAHPPARMKPIPTKATEGRANPHGIACLYLATKKDTAVLEVRPLIGSYVSVAQFKVMRELRLVFCAGGDWLDHLVNRWAEPASLTPEEIENEVWLDINEAFSKPVERGDYSIEYVSTQILAEAFKRNRFDGIAYKSSYGENGFNVALFNIDDADLINCGLHRIKDVSIEMTQEDNPYVIKLP